MVSLPSVGAWVEIPGIFLTPLSWMSLPSVGAWVEIESLMVLVERLSRSLPSVGAWVEISDV